MPVPVWLRVPLQALYHGSSASVLKTVPKYVCAIWVKDYVAAQLPPPTAAAGTSEHRTQVLNRAAVKSVAAGVAGAALTNPLDVIRNEMFKFEVRRAAAAPECRAVDRAVPVACSCIRRFTSGGAVPWRVTHALCVPRRRGRGRSRLARRCAG
jgi:hypothetical protein